MHRKTRELRDVRWDENVKGRPPPMGTAAQILNTGDARCYAEIGITFRYD